MGYPNPRQAILAQVVQPRAQPILQSWSRAGHVRADIARGGGYDADPNTVRFVKVRGIPGQELHAVTFADRDGKNYRFLIGVVKDPDGRWGVSGQAGGGGNDPPRDRPWVNFCGWGWPHSFNGGGWVVGSGSAEATSVRLRFQNGTILEDTVDDRVTLLIADTRVDMPATAEILDPRGSVLASHTAF
jgi:hypothetical protein